jgi:uncharacterized cupredoxin-like copper-binding protein
MGRLRTMLVLVAVLGTLLAACGDGEDRPGDASVSGSVSGTGSVSGAESGKATFSEDDADSVVHLTESEYEIEADMESAKGPHVFLEIKNDGEEKHELVVEDADGKVLIEKEDIEPGKEATLAVDAKPGTYTLVCELKNADGKSHEDLGMKRTLKVT